MLQSVTNIMAISANGIESLIKVTDILPAEGSDGLLAFANAIVEKALAADDKTITLEPRQLAQLATDSKLNPKEIDRMSLSSVGAIFADLGVWSLQCEDHKTTSFVPGSHQRQIGYVDRQVKSVSIGPVKDLSALTHDWELKSVVRPDEKYLLRTELEDDPYASGVGLIGNGNGNLSTGSFRIFQYHDNEKPGQPNIRLDIHKDEPERQRNEPGIDFVQYQGKPAFSQFDRPLVPRKGTIRIDKESQVFLSLNIPSSDKRVSHTFELAIDPLIPRAYGTNHLVGEASGLTTMVGYSVLDANDKPVKNTYGTHLVGVKQISGSADHQKFRAIHFDNGKKHSAAVSFPRLPSHLLLATEDNLGEAIDGLENYAKLLEVLFTVESR